MAVSTIKGIEKDIYHLQYADGWEFRKRGEIVFLRTNNFKGLPAGAFTIGTIPEAFRPKFSLSYTSVVRSTKVPVAVIIETNGTVRGYNYGSAVTGTAPAQDVISYPTD